MEMQEYEVTVSGLLTEKEIRSCAIGMGRTLKIKECKKFQLAWAVTIVPKHLDETGFAQSMYFFGRKIGNKIQLKK